MDAPPRTAPWGMLRRPAVRDAAIAVLVAALSVAALWNPPPFVDFDFRDPDPLGVALAVAGGAAVAFRSSRPVAATLVALAAVVPLTQLGYSQSIGGMAALLTLYSVAVSRPLRTSVPALVLTVTVLGTVLVTTPLAATPSDWAANLFVVATAWAFGRSVRVRRTHVATVHARNSARLAAQAAETRAMLAEERARVVREMQDLVAHTLTELNVQVCAARRTLDRGDPHAAEQLLADAEGAGRTALGEMRRAVELLGPDDNAGSRMRPQPTIADLEDLVARERTSGLDVRLVATGAGEGVPPGVALTAYRVVEQALAAAHADGSASAEVILGRTGDDLSVRVRSTPRSPRVRWREEESPDTGALERLRTRVELYGGRLQLAPTRDGGTDVSARLPTATGRTA